MYSETDYFCVVENGGKQLLRFTQLAHDHISAGKMNNFSEWQPVVRLIMKQMVQCIEFMLSVYGVRTYRNTMNVLDRHSKRICHFDISLENVIIAQHEGGYIQCKLCDFGLSEFFKSTDFTTQKYCGMLSL